MTSPHAGSDCAAVFAPAKLNLCLHVTGQRPDGYHLLDSLVVFPGIGDRVTAEPSDRLSLTLAGPFAAGLPADGDNLVLKAARLMPGCPAALRLEKNLPVASGIGGGSADAAATLRALSAAHGAPLPAGDAVLALGADVPVCLEGRPARMRGIGEIIEPVPALPPFWVVLANPGVACPTPAVFARLERKSNAGIEGMPPRFDGARALFSWLRTTRNDLEPPAAALLPPIARAIVLLGASAGCALARMSGSGATCFGLFAERGEAIAAAEALRSTERGWWIAAAPVGP